MPTIYEAQKINPASPGCRLQELFSPHSSNLNWLGCSRMELANCRSMELSHPHNEVLLVNLKDAVRVCLEGKDYRLEHYDMFYVPPGMSYFVEHSGGEEGKGEGLLYLYRAAAAERYEPYHARYRECRESEARVRTLNRKVVYKMFDVSENANKLIAGYTFYQDHTRAWPPHNHTDQEEVYSFIEGRGAMEVYACEEQKTFVTSVASGDHVTIPLLNYHPVFSHEEPLAFIWCIAGERYWVGDRNSDFMDGTADRLTT